MTTWETNNKIRDLNASEFLDFSVRLLKSRREGKYITTLRPHGTKLPFFAIPGFLLYRQLAFYMGEDQPFYGFEPFARKNIEDAASRYIIEMKRIQPQGPYLLGAFCDHYPIVFEMADILSKKGDHVPLIVLFESYAPSVLRPKTSYHFIKERMKLYAEQLRNTSFVFKFRFLGKEFKKVVEAVSRQLYHHKKETYCIKHFSGTLALFKAAASVIACKADPLRGWPDYAHGRIEVFTIAGRHLDIMKYPHVIELADSLTKILDEVNKASALTTG